MSKSTIQASGETCSVSQRLIESSLAVRAVQLVGPHHLEFVDAEAPRSKPGEAIVRMEYLAVCGSDLKLYERVLPAADYPLPVGRPCHECVAIVEDASDTGLKRGQRVIALTNKGGLVEYQSLATDMLVPLPELDMDPALWVLCQPMGTVMYAVKRIGSVLGKRVAVVGQGPIGLAFTDLLVRHGARQIIATDVHDYRLEISRKLGATQTINAAREDVAARVKDITAGAMVDIVVEACGLPETYAQVFAILRSQGTVVIFGGPHIEDKFTFDWGTVYNKLPNIIVTNSMRAGERSEAVADCVDLVAQRRLDLSYLLTHRFTWHEIPKAFEQYCHKTDNSLKGVIAA